MSQIEKQKAVDEFMSKPQPKDRLGFLEPSCSVLHGYSWTPENGLAKNEAGQREAGAK